MSPGYLLDHLLRIVFLIHSKDGELIVESKYPAVIGGNLDCDISLNKEDESHSDMDESG
jgi:hypothetical protein